MWPTGNESSESRRECPLGGQSGDFFWFGLQSLITLLNISAIAANVFFIVVCGKAGVMHRNMRLMLCNISGCFAVNATAGLLYNAYFFYLGIFSFPTEKHTSVWCSLINVLMVPWDAATILLMIGVGAERFIATRHHLPSGAISIYVKVIFFLAWAVACFVTVQYLLNLTPEGQCVCDGASLADRYAMLMRIVICAIVEAGTISLFGYVLLHSRSEADNLWFNTAKYSLSKRFQIYETYRTTQMLLPSVCLHAILYLSYLVSLFPIRDLRARPSLSLTEYNLSTLVFALPSMHALAHPLICLTRHYYLRQRTSEIVTRLSPGSKKTVLLSGETQKLSVDTAPSCASSTVTRVDFRVAPERHAEILSSFWDKK